MKNAKLNWVRLPLEGVENCRELGGYETEDGGIFPWHQFLRSDDMSALTDQDIQFLEEYGVKTIIDLRGEDEISKSKNPMSEASFCTYYNIPLSTQPVEELSFLSNVTMGDFYVHLLEDGRENIKAVFETIALAKEGTVLFHCAAGKDRTGIIAMLLLGLAGVRKKDIVSNYEVTYSNLERLQEKIIQITADTDVPEHLLYSKREYIIQAYEHLIDTYQSIENYLGHIGLDKLILHRIKQRMQFVSDSSVALYE